MPMKHTCLDLNKKPEMKTHLFEDGGSSNRKTGRWYEFSLMLFTILNNKDKTLSAVL
jgi:hypothetical protein